MTIQEMPILNIINSSCPNYRLSQQVENLSKTDLETVLTFTGNAPRKGIRAPIKQFKYSEEHDGK